MSVASGTRRRFLMLNWRDPRNPLAGGAERVSLAYMQALVDRGHEVDWFAFAFPGAAPEERIGGVRIRRGGKVFSAILEARRWCRRQRPYDLVIDQHHGIPWYAPWWSGTRCLAYIHEVLGPIWSSFYRWPANWIGPLQERWTHRFYRHVPFWVPSESTRRALLRHGVKSVRVLDNGVDIEPLAELAPVPPSNPIQLVSVSRLAPNKRVEHAVQCLDELRRRGVKARLTVIGDGSERANLEGLTTGLSLRGEVVFAGYQPEAEKLRILRESHLLLHPSVREGWGLNVIEANAMGVPAVVYPVDGLVDSTVDQVTGVICPRETPAALADGVQWAMENSERHHRLREAAWRRSFEYRWRVVLPPACEFLEQQASGLKMG